MSASLARNVLHQSVLKMSEILKLTFKKKQHLKPAIKDIAAYIVITHRHRTQVEKYTTRAPNTNLQTHTQS